MAFRTTSPLPPQPNQTQNKIKLFIHYIDFIFFFSNRMAISYLPLIPLSFFGTINGVVKGLLTKSPCFIVPNVQSKLETRGVLPAAPLISCCMPQAKAALNVCGNH